MVNVAIFASGSGSNFENIVNSKLQYGEVKLLVVDIEDTYAVTRANRLGIPYVYVNPKAFTTKEAYEEQILEYLNNYNIELIALAGYMRFIGKVLLTHYPKRIINLHPAYLPEFPGAHSIKEAFEAEVTYSGVTIHYVDEGIDTGEIISQEKIWIDKKWDMGNFEETVHEFEYKMFPSVLDDVCKEVEHEKSIN